MATCRTAINEAMRSLRAIGVGDSPTADELAAALEAAQGLVLDIHQARGPLWDVDVAANYVPGEDQRVRVVDADTVTITLPNSIQMWGGYDPYDYGFRPGLGPIPQIGSTGPADGIRFRAPRDGTRIEIVGTRQALFFYRADLNQWMPATGLTVDTELPFNNGLVSAFEALLAERLADVVSAAPPTPTLLKRIARGRTALFLQVGRHHTRRVGEYL